MSRVQSAQGCTSHGCATGKKKPNQKVRFSLQVALEDKNATLSNNSTLISLSFNTHKKSKSIQ